MIAFLFGFYTLVTVLFLILCVGESEHSAKVLYAVIAVVTAFAQISVGWR